MTACLYTKFCSAHGWDKPTYCHEPDRRQTDGQSITLPGQKLTKIARLAIKGDIKWSWWIEYHMELCNITPLHAGVADSGVVCPPLPWKRIIAKVYCVNKRLAASFYCRPQTPLVDSFQWCCTETRLEILRFVCGYNCLYVGLYNRAYVACGICIRLRSLQTRTQLCQELSVIFSPWSIIDMMASLTHHRSTCLQLPVIKNQQISRV